MLSAVRRLIVAALHLFTAALCVAPALAQSPQEAPVRIARPQLVIPGRVEAPVTLESVSIRAEVHGRFALTEVELTFRNPNRRILEGELQFPLPEAQSVTGFAMDVDGKLRDAVPVDKARGQAVFEEITRGRIDPGLLEATQGNNFKLRVYPIPAAGVKRVVLRYGGPLAEHASRLAYVLPLDYAERVGSFSLELRVSGAAGTPQVAASALGALALAREDGQLVARMERSEFAGRGLLRLDFVPASGPRIHTQVFDGHTYFHAELPLTATVAPRELPKVVGLAWDSSGSGAARDHGREFALLDVYFRRLRDGEVRLTRLRDAAEPVQRFRISNGDWRALRAALEATAYDGATNLGAFIRARSGRSRPRRKAGSRTAVDEGGADRRARVERRHAANGERHDPVAALAAGCAVRCAAAQRGGGESLPRVPRGAPEPPEQHGVLPRRRRRFFRQRPNRACVARALQSRGDGPREPAHPARARPAPAAGGRGPARDPGLAQGGGIESRGAAVLARPRARLRRRPAVPEGDRHAL